MSPIPKEGLGLNPILKDPVGYSPLLYIGFVESSIYFSAAMALVTNYSEKYFATSIKNWVLISWVFQTLLFWLVRSGLTTSLAGVVSGFGSS